MFKGSVPSTLFYSILFYTVSNIYSPNDGLFFYKSSHPLHDNEACSCLSNSHCYALFSESIPLICIYLHTFMPYECSVFLL